MKNKKPKGQKEYTRYPGVKSKNKIRKLPSAQKLLKKLSRPGTVLVQDPDATVVMRTPSINFPTNKTGVKHLIVEMSSSLSSENYSLHGLYTKARVPKQTD